MNDLALGVSELLIEGHFPELMGFQERKVKKDSQPNSTFNIPFFAKSRVRVAS